MDKREVFESRVNRAFVVGAMVGGVISFLFLLWFEHTQFKRSHLYLVMTIFLIGLGVVGKARKLVAQSDFYSPELDKGKLLFWIVFAWVFAFIDGSILSLGALLTIYDYSRMI